MTNDEAFDVFAASLRRVAPEVDLELIDQDGPMLDELELDSMDFLSLVTELHERTGLEIPESDYPQLDTVAAVLSYLASKPTTNGEQAAHDR